MSDAAVGSVNAETPLLLNCRGLFFLCLALTACQRTPPLPPIKAAQGLHQAMQFMGGSETLTTLRSVRVDQLTERTAAEAPPETDQAILYFPDDLYQAHSSETDTFLLAIRDGQVWMRMTAEDSLRLLAGKEARYMRQSQWFSLPHVLVQAAYYPSKVQARYLGTATFLDQPVHALQLKHEADLNPNLLYLDPATLDPVGYLTDWGSGHTSAFHFLEWQTYTTPQGKTIQLPTEYDIYNERNTRYARVRNRWSQLNAAPPFPSEALLHTWPPTFPTGE